MGFAMRMKLNDQIIKKESFKNLYINGAPNGFSFDVYLDGEKMPQEAVTFELNGKEMPVYKLKYAVTEFWSQVVPATIRVIRKGGVPAGEHELELKLMLRVPYMEIGPDHTFMPLDSGEKVTVQVSE